MVRLRRPTDVRLRLPPRPNARPDPWFWVKKTRPGDTLFKGATPQKGSGSGTHTARTAPHRTTPVRTCHVSHVTQRQPTPTQQTAYTGYRHTPPHAGHSHTGHSTRARGTWSVGSAGTATYVPHITGHRHATPTATAPVAVQSRSTRSALVTPPPPPCPKTGKELLHYGPRRPGPAARHPSRTRYTQRDAAVAAHA